MRIRNPAPPPPPPTLTGVWRCIQYVGVYSRFSEREGARGQGGWRWARWGEQLSYVRGCHTYFLLSYFAGFTFFQIVLPEEIYIISEGSIPLKSELFLLFVLGAPPPQPTTDRRHEILRYCAEEDRDTGHGRYRHDGKELCSY
jgi:hypothetical protein